MPIPAAEFARNEILEAIISRAEAGCERYRQAAEKPGLHPQTARTRRQILQQMALSLARLRSQRMFDHATGIPAALEGAA